MKTLDRSFYSRDSAEVARALLGKILEKEGMKGRIVETEAYYGKEDPASHASSGKTDRNELMFGKAGRIYVYLCYGLHYLLNITTRSKGKPGAVLIRALEPLEGLNRMKSNRSTKRRYKLTDGPGRLTEALGIDKGGNGADVTSGDSEIKVFKDGLEGGEVGKSGRIGINHGQERQLRFFLKDSKFLSR